MIKSSYSENKFQIANLKNFVYIYIKICFNITILLHMLFLSIKCMHSIDNVVYALLQSTNIVTNRYMSHHTGCGVIMGSVKNLITASVALLPGNTVIKSWNRSLVPRFQHNF